MSKSEGELAHKRLIGIIWLIGVCFFNTVPLLVISFLANLDSVRGLSGKLRANSENTTDQSICPLPRIMVLRVAKDICHRIWCSASYGFWLFQFLLAYHYAL